MHLNHYMIISLLFSIFVVYTKCKNTPLQTIQTLNTDTETRFFFSKNSWGKREVCHSLALLHSLEKAIVLSCQTPLPQLLSEKIKNPLVRHYLNLAIHQGTLSPLIQLWHAPDFEEQCMRKDFIQDCIRLNAAILYATINSKSTYYKTVKINSESLITAYQTIDSLPVEEMLSAIDVMANEIPSIIQQYEFNSQLTWKQWLKKYWWTPPVIIVRLILKVLLALKRPIPSFLSRTKNIPLKK